ncbi:hypothetical protein PF005_g9398 [Phytophthora fragariae]|uniref:Uncharacterized protein n=1 Tax=Phytophthora fragariae TaxID=53985 RepID=A0A6A4DRT5_9STRA|nr:hypothetical protein PF003_g17825 [Phytophthora fragariae]KAE8939849.1 hypothetical protein PF009_g10321 [Phytophthora fragariae]KAE9014169.1 hypothetical protein PF011_g8180 [Phytophthora fragariae]KAE9112944.1 hypothetical protein PF007_g10904 [Phytophthora fragariae]KAE9117156.1 hypothetical protein PF010_g8706 [Phytophthora fragariae]
MAAPSLQQLSVISCTCVSCACGSTDIARTSSITSHIPGGIAWSHRLKIAVSTPACCRPMLCHGRRKCRLSN